MSREPSYMERLRLPPWARDVLIKGDRKSADPKQAEARLRARAIPKMVAACRPTLPIVDGFITKASYIAEWERLIKIEQAERSAFFPELEAKLDEQYLKAYTYAAGQILSNLEHMGWARAKGFYKHIIRDLAQSYPYGPHLPLAHIDAILDSVN